MADKKIYNLADKNKSLANDIDKLYQVWFDPTSHEIKKNDDNIEHVDDSLDKLSIIVRQLKLTLSNDKNDRDAQDALSDINDFINGDASAALSLMKSRDRDDHICKLVWLINLTTPVAVLSKELKDAEKPLDKGPLSKRNITSQNIEHAVVAIPNSKQMKSPSKFLSDVLPNSFAAIAKNKAAAKAAARRSAFSGAEYHNVATMDSLYYDIGSALVFVSTAIFAEANRAFTENGKRQSAEKLADVDFSTLTDKERDVMMGTLTAGFRKYSNYTGELEMFSNLSEKMTLDAALRTYYEFLNDAQKTESGFTEEQLMSLPYARAFAKKYSNQFKASYDRYMNRFIDGIMDALKKEQETVNKDWFENKITGERVFRRGRLAGHGAKFMATGPMKWLDEKLSEKNWGSLWLVPKLGMGVLKVLTNPAVHKARKKLMAPLWGALRAFATGFKESFDKTGRSLEISSDDVEKVIKEGIKKLQKIKNDKKTVVAESNSMFSHFGDDDEVDDSFVASDKAFTKEDADKCKNAFNKAIDILKTASSEEAVKEDIDSANSVIDQLNSDDMASRILNMPDDAQIELDGVSDEEFAEIRTLAANVTSYIAKFEEVQDEREKTDQGNAADKGDSAQSIEVGEKTVAICEEVFETVNKYLARQWNLLALHSMHKDMPLCAMYETIELDEFIKRAAKPEGYNNPSKSRADDRKHIQTNKRLEKGLSDIHENLEFSLHNWLAEKLNEFEPDDDIKTRNRAQGYTVDGANPHANNKNRSVEDTYLRHGEATAEYPLRNKSTTDKNGKTVQGKYTYHGIALEQAEGSDKNGFGVFAERIAKIAPLLTEFKTTVELMGDQSNAKTFDNSDKDEPVNATESYVDPAELLADDRLDEDLANKIFKQADKAADKVGKAASMPVKGLGHLAGAGVGKAIHGIKNLFTGGENLAKTVEDNMELTYTFSKSLRLSYLKDGVSIVGKHCISAAASKEFDNIGKLVSALSEAKIPTSRSIESITVAVNSFANAVKGIQFKPCKTVIDFELADKINTGALTDSTDSPDSGHIKGFYIGNFEATRNIVRPITDDDKQAMAELADADKKAEERRAIEAEEAKKREAESEKAKAAEVEKAKAAEDAQLEADKEAFMNQSIDKEKATTVNAESPKHEPIDTNVTIPSHNGYSKANPPSKEELRNMNSKQRKKLAKQGIIKRANINGESAQHNFEKLAMLLETVNDINWKDIL